MPGSRLRYARRNEKINLIFIRRLNSFAVQVISQHARTFHMFDVLAIGTRPITVFGISKFGDEKIHAVGKK